MSLSFCGQSCLWFSRAKIHFNAAELASVRENTHWVVILEARKVSCIHFLSISSMAADNLSLCFSDPGRRVCGLWHVSRSWNSRQRQKSRFWLQVGNKAMAWKMSYLATHAWLVIFISVIVLMERHNLSLIKKLQYLPNPRYSMVIIYIIFRYLDVTGFRKWVRLKLWLPKYMKKIVFIYVYCMFIYFKYTPHILYICTYSVCVSFDSLILKSKEHKNDFSLMIIASNKLLG